MEYDVNVYENERADLGELGDTEYYQNIQKGQLEWD